MLQAFRSKGLTSAIYGILIVGIILVFVLGFNPSAGKQKASLSEMCAARVKGHCITPKDHMAAYRLLIPRGEQNEPLMQQAKQMGILRVSLDGLVERELLVTDAERLGITVTDDEVTDSIYDGFIRVSLPSDKESLAASLRIGNGRVRANFRDSKTKRFDLKAYERTIKAATGRSPTEFREEQAREILAAKVRDIVKTPVRVSEAEALAGYVDERSTATLDTVMVRASYVARYLPPLSGKEVDDWLADAANKKVVEDAVKEYKGPHIRHILIKVSPGASDAEKQTAKARIDAALARVKGGEPFAKVARELSEDPGSGANGGDVGDRTEGFVAPFKDAADKLKPGEMTEAPVETQFGYHIILRDPEMTEEARTRLVATELATKAKATSAAKTMADAIQAGLTSGKEAQTTIDAQIATLLPRDRPAAPAPKDKKKGGAKADGAPVVAAPRADDDPERPQIVATSPFNRGGEPISGLSPEDNAKVIQFAFTAKDKDGMDQVLKADHDYVLVSLKSHKTATKDEFAKDKDIYMQTLVRQKEDEAFALYMKRLKDAAKNEIKINETYLADKMGTNKSADGGAPAQEDEDEGP